MPTSTDTKAQGVANTSQSGVLSSRQKIALIQKNQWWPFTQVDGKLLVRLHKQHQRKQITNLPESPL